jgi:chromosome segregation ATPase
MAQHLGQFSKDLRLKLTNVESGLESLKGKIDGKAENAEQEARKHLDSVRKRIEQSRPKIAAAEAEMKTWLDAEKATSSEKIAEWKAKLETAKLQNRVDLAERYAAAALAVALAAVDNVEKAVLEAWLARRDAKTVSPKR